jgi:hypothetical protein
MSKPKYRRVFKLVENDDPFWVDLRKISESLGWDLGQTLKYIFALGWELLSQRVNFTQKGTEDDEE